MADEPVDREDEVQKHLCKPSALPPEMVKYEPPADLDRLLDGLTSAKLWRIFEQVMKCKEDKINPVRGNPGTIERESVSLEQKAGQLLTFAKDRKHFGFRQLSEGQGDKLEVVVTFLTVLRLMKIGRIRLKQEETLGDVEIEALDQDDGDVDLDLKGMGDS